MTNIEKAARWALAIRKARKGILANWGDNLITREIAARALGFTGMTKTEIAKTLGVELEATK